MAVILPRPIHIPYQHDQCAKFGDGGAFINGIFYVCCV